MHDGTPVELGQGGHVIHALLIHGVHSHHLLVCNCALLVCEDLVGGKEFNGLVISDEQFPRRFAQLTIRPQYSTSKKIQNPPAKNRLQRTLSLPLCHLPIFKGSSYFEN